MGALEELEEIEARKMSTYVQPGTGGMDGAGLHSEEGGPERGRCCELRKYMSVSRPSQTL